MDPLEKIIADALDVCGIKYQTGFGGENPSGLDFRLPSGVEIEVKRFHTPRISEQMSRSSEVIALQGESAVRFFAMLLVHAARKGEQYGSARLGQPAPTADA
jgi:hypothetical protein